MPNLPSNLMEPLLKWTSKRGYEWTEDETKKYHIWSAPYVHKRVERIETRSDQNLNRVVHEIIRDFYCDKCKFKTKDTLELNTHTHTSIGYIT